MIVTLGALAVVGVLAERRLRKGVRPASVEVVVRTDAADARLAERDVALPLEAALHRAHGVRTVRIRAMARLVFATCTGDGSVDESTLRLRVLAAAHGAAMPIGADVALGAGGPDARPLRRLTVGAHLSPTDRHALVDRLRRATERVAGVGDVRVCGDSRPIVRVLIDAPRMAASGVTLSALRAAVAAGALRPTGELVVRTTPVVVHLRDVAQVEAGFAPPACDAWRHGPGDIATLDVVGSADVEEDVVANDVERATSGVGAPPFSLWMLPASREHTTTALLLAPLGQPESVWRALHDLGDSLAALPDAREVIVEVPRDGRGRLRVATGEVEPPVGAARVTVVGAHTAPVIDAVVAGVPGFVLVPASVDRVVRVVGDDLDVDRRLAVQARDLAAATPGIVGAAVLDVGDAPWLDVRPDEAMLVRAGLSTTDSSDVVQLAAEDGLALGVVREGGESLDVVAVAPGASLARPSSLAELPVLRPDGQVMPLSAVAELRLGLVPGQIVRIDGHRVIEVAVWGDARAMDRAEDAIRGGLRIPSGMWIEIVTP